MSAKPHDARFRALSKSMVPDHRNVSEADRKAVEGVNRAERRAKKKRVDAVYARCIAVMAMTANSGAGLVADKAIRELADECNIRNLSHGLTSLPMRFNVMEAFIRFVPKDNACVVLPEQDHVFSLADFLDFQTGPDADDNVEDGLALLEEGVVYSYNAIGDLEALSFLDGEGNRFVAAAISFVRHGDELSWILVGGNIVDIAAETARIQEEWIEKKADFLANNRKHLDIEDGPPAEAVALDGAPNTWRTLFLGRTTLRPMTHDVRYLCRDEGATYDTYTDDPAIFQVARIERLTSGQLDYLARGEAELSKNSLATRIADTLFSLPAYFRFKVRLVVDQQRRTNLGDPAVVRDLGRALGAAANSERVVFRKVAALEIVDLEASPAIRSYRPPSHQVAVEGFWRRLSSPEADGVDQNGLPTKGRTWVKGHMRWRQQPPPPVVVLVKNSVASARVRAAVALIQKNGVSSADLPEFGGLPDEAPEEMRQGANGWVYVMSSPLLPDSVYKVGWTSKTPAARSEDLSRQTGVPMAFVVVESWQTPMAREAERLVHQALSSHRINPRREFFKLPFAEIRRTVENVLVLLDVEATSRPPCPEPVPG